MKNKEVWPFLFLLGLLAFNWPIMALFEGLLPYYLYAFWFLFIVIIGLLATDRSRMEKPPHV